jgi:ABC-2 type transport system ATP-binding protein
VAGDQEAAARLLEQHDKVNHVDMGKGHLTVTLVDGHREYSDLATLLVNAGYKLTLLREDELNLETAFMALTKGITS